MNPAIAAALDSCLTNQRAQLVVIARAIAGNADDAENLIAEASARILARVDALDGRDLVGLFKVIMRNAWTDQGRSAGRGALSFDVAMDEETGLTFNDVLAHPEDVASDYAEDRQRRADFVTVHRILDRMPPRQAGVLTFVDLDGLTYDETARALSIPINTARSLISRARDRFRKEFGREVLVTAWEVGHGPSR